jgi:hypothetical protein
MTARTRAQIIDRDRGWAKLRKRLKQRKVVDVGVRGDHKNDRTGTGPTNLDLATIHELGLGNNPERSFIRASVDDKEADIQRLQKRLAIAVYTLKMTPKKALELLGQKVAAWMKLYITSGKVKPGLDPKTVAARKHGGSKPLWDTKQMGGSITYEVVNK